MGFSHFFFYSILSSSTLPLCCCLLALSLFDLALCFEYCLCLDVVVLFCSVLLCVALVLGPTASHSSLSLSSIELAFSVAFVLSLARSCINSSRNHIHTHTHTQSSGPPLRIPSPRTPTLNRRRFRPRFHSRLLHARFAIDDRVLVIVDCRLTLDSLVHACTRCSAVRSTTSPRAEP